MSVELGLFEVRPRRIDLQILTGWVGLSPVRVVQHVQRDQVRLFVPSPGGYSATEPHFHRICDSLSIVTKT